MPAYRRRAVQVAAILLSGAFAGPVSAQLRIVNFNVAGLNGNMASMQDVFAALNADDKPGFAVAPHLYVFQEVHSSDVAPLLTMLNAAAPPGVTYTQGTYTNISENSTSGAQAMFYRADTLTEDLAAHIDIFTQAGRYADRWKMQLVGYSSPDAAIYIYSMHLKASNTSADANLRLTGATAVRNNADALPAGTHIIYAGDFNVYHNGEAAYLKFLSTGNGQALDPLGSGTWAGIANAIKHSQAPCNSGCSLVSGGMDDRFDFQLSTSAFQDAEGIALIPGTYRSFGNDGNHYNNSINAGNNTYYPADIPRSNALAADLFVASDHVPVVADYQVPAVLADSMPAGFGRVIQGATFNVFAEISNAAEAIVSAGADELDFAAIGSGVLSGTPSGSVAALAGPASISFTVDTSTIGQRDGQVTVTSNSQAVQYSPIYLVTSGHVLGHANGSFSESEDEDSQDLSFTFEPDTGVKPINVGVFNFGFHADQSMLDVDAVNGLSPPFALAGPLPTNLAAGSAAIPLSIDTTGLIPGLYTAILVVAVSDEDLPGESTHNLALTLDIQIGAATIPGDINCDAILDAADIDTFVSVVLDLDGETCHVTRADLDDSSTVDGLDITLLLDVFLN